MLPHFPGDFYFCARRKAVGGGLKRLTHRANQTLVAAIASIAVVAEMSKR